VAFDGNLVFNVTERRKCINITIIDDNIEEGLVPETINVQIRDVRGSSIEATIGLGKILIKDSDSMCLHS